MHAEARALLLANFCHHSTGGKLLSSLIGYTYSIQALGSDENPPRERDSIVCSVKSTGTLFAEHKFGWVIDIRMETHISWVK